MYFVAAPKRAFEDFFHVRHYDEPDPLEVHLRVRGAQCRTAEGLFDEFAAVFQFPWYFSHNWASFNSLISDLHGMLATSFTLGIEDTNVVLEDDPRGFNILVDILRTASIEWATPKLDQDKRCPLPFTTIFHAEPERAAVAQDRLKQAKADVVLRRIEIPDYPA